MLREVPPLRLRQVNDAPVRPEREFVLYWMIASRRTHHNWGLQRALLLARELGRPLVILEALRCDHPWASARFHTFVVQGMADTARAARGRSVCYYPYVERSPGQGAGLLEALAERACVVVTDDFPTFFLPRMVEAAGRRLTVRLEKVDSNGLLPLRATDQVFGRAFDFRRYLQRALAPHLTELPHPDPLSVVALPPLPGLGPGIEARWPRVSEEELARPGAWLGALPIDHHVGAVDLTLGGSGPARRRLTVFLDQRLSRYPEDRSEPDLAIASELSPYLHFGHLSVYEVFTELMERQSWSPERLGARVTGAREGWWGVDGPTESYLDELITWREIGYNFCSKREDYDRYESLPDWARATLEEHAGDERSPCFDLATLEGARTYDPLWNAAQTQLVKEGIIHNYLRMLWGKKILQWTASPREALEVMIHLNNKYALDGRNPNSYSGIFWVLGRYDRPWAPKRPIFGVIRYMSSENTARKLGVKLYLRRHAPNAGGGAAQESFEWKALRSGS